MTASTNPAHLKVTLDTGEDPVPAVEFDVWAPIPFPASTPLYREHLDSARHLSDMFVSDFRAGWVA